MSEPTDSRHRIPVFTSQEDYVRTMRELRRTLVSRRKAVGRDHPDVLAARDGIGLAFLGAGKPAKAISVLRMNLRARGRAMPEDHPDTLTTASNLAIAYQSVGAFARAIKLQEVLLSHQRRVLGDDHDDTQVTRNNLGMAYQARGLTQPAIAVFEQALTVGRAALGDDADADTIAGNLGSAYATTRDFGRALPLLESVLAARRRIYGDGDDRTLMAAKALGIAYRDAGDLTQAVTTFDQLLADRQRYAGDSHPEMLLTDRGRYDKDTLDLRAALAHVHERAGDRKLAVAQLTGLLPDCRRRLGASHSLTKAVKRDLRRLR